MVIGTVCLEMTDNTQVVLHHVCYFYMLFIEYYVLPGDIYYFNHVMM